MPALVPVFLALVATPVSAEPLAWSWQVGQPVLYHAEVVRETIDGDWYFAAENLEARAQQVTLSVDLSCQAVDATSKRTFMECHFHNVQVSGTSFPGEQDALSAIFDEYEGYLAGAHASFDLSSVGRLRSFDLHAMDVTNERLGVVAESLRQLMSRPFAQLELELPKKGDDGGKPWKQGGTPVLTQLRSSYGTTGNVAIKHSVSGADQGVVSIETEGRGNVAYGLAMEGDGTRIINVNLAGAAQFDSAAGQLVQRESMVVGRFTAGSTYSDVSDHFREVATLTRIDELPAPQTAPAEPERQGDESPPVEEAPETSAE